MPFPGTGRRRGTGAWGLGAATAALCWAAAPPGAGPAAARRTLDAVVALLAAEARLIVAAGLEPPAEADFSRRYAVAPDAGTLLDALRRRLDGDPFVDAWVRYQLSSFDPDLGALDDRAFEEFLHRAPPLVENPAARPQALEALERAAAAERLTERDLERLRRTVTDMEADRARCRKLNAAAEGFLEWAQRRLGPGGPRPARWRLGRCAATVAAGWPAATVKADVRRELEAAAADPALHPAGREAIVRHARALVGLERRYVEQVTFMADGSVRVAYGQARVTAGDVDRWVAGLTGPPP